MRLSTIPFLLAGLIAFVGWLALRAEHHKAIRRGNRLRIWAVLVILVAWAAASALLASTGAYLSEDSLRLLPGLWLPAVPFVIVGLALGVSRNFLSETRTVIGIQVRARACARHGVCGATSAPVRGPVPPRRVCEGGGGRLPEDEG